MVRIPMGFPGVKKRAFGGITFLTNGLAWKAIETSVCFRLRPYDILMITMFKGRVLYKPNISEGAPG